MTDAGSQASCDSATRFAEPPVIADQAAIAHSVDDGGELRSQEVVDASGRGCS
jgi:hypothetical protein